MDLNDFLAKENGPSWLPASVTEARKLVYIGQLLALVFALISVFVGIVSILTGNFFYGIVSLAMAGVGMIVLYMLKDNVFDHLDQGRFKQASDSLLIWSIVGIFIWLIPGIILLLGYLKLQTIFQPQYQQYQAQEYQAAPQAVQQPQRPAPQQPAPPAEHAPEEKKEKKVEMTKCRKCGVNYPSFMHSCPSCNEPRH
ncbi:MAG TPA: hypothetical protein VMW85_04245 [Methanomassiliicoccales archaeon]|nr:hypothetical protein [Methanomassiliicoccales archaeon]